MSVAAVIQAIFRHPTVTDGAADSNRRGNSFIPGNKTDRIWRPWGSGLFSIDDIRDWVIRRSTEVQIHLLAVLSDYSLSTTSGLSFRLTPAPLATNLLADFRSTSFGLLCSSRISKCNSC